MNLIPVRERKVYCCAKTHAPPNVIKAQEQARDTGVAILERALQPDVISNSPFKIPSEYCPNIVIWNNPTSLNICEKQEKSAIKPPMLKVAAIVESILPDAECALICSEPGGVFVDFGKRVTIPVSHTALRCAISKTIPADVL